MIRLVYSNRTESLVEALVEALEEHRRHPLDTFDLVLPNRHLEAYVRFQLAQRLGIAAGLRFLRLETLVSRTLAARYPGARLLDRWTLFGSVLEVLMDTDETSRPEYSAIHAYIRAVEDSRGQERRRIQLARHLTHLYEEYSLHRPDWVQAWRRGEPVGGHGSSVPPQGLGWQATLFRQVIQRLGPSPGGQENGDSVLAWVGLDELVGASPRFRLELPDPAFLFGLSYVAPLYQQLFARLGASEGLYLFTLNPCCEFWEDLETDREFRRRADRFRRLRKTYRVGPEALLVSEDPYGLLEHEDNLALRRWGAPGRESIRRLNEITECDFEPRFAPPLGDDLLSRLQRDILFREPHPPVSDAARIQDHRTDATPASIGLASAPSLRREVEDVVEQIWLAVEASGSSGSASAPPLRFDQIGILLPADALSEYLPHLSAAAAATELPLAISDRPHPQLESALDGANRLLSLTGSDLSRPEMLGVLNHPAFRFGSDQGEARPWADLAEELGILFGADRSTFTGTYVDRDLLSWDQGIRRLVLGACMDLEPGETVAWRGEEYSPATSPSGLDPVRLRFGLAARTVLDFLMPFHGTGLYPLADWVERATGTLESLLQGVDEETRDTISRLLEPISSLPISTPVTGFVAANLMQQALNGTAPSHGNPLSGGVVVSSFLPMRAVPFRRLYVLGLGEGRFPVRRRHNPLDLRSSARRSGDVRPEERDRYAFLEALLSAREHFGLYWTARDPLTGEELRPSLCIRELQEVITATRGRPLSPRSIEETRDATPPSAAPEAAREAWALALGEEYRTLHPKAPQILTDQLRSHPPLPGSGAELVDRLLEIPRHLAVTARDGRQGPTRVRSRQLAEFLLCPMQAWATVATGLHRPDDAEAELRHEEHWKTPPLELVVARRNAFVSTLGTQQDPARALEERLEALELAGRSAVGTLLDFEITESLPTMSHWAEILAAASEGEDPTLRSVAYDLPPDPLGDRVASENRYNRLEFELELPTGHRSVQFSGKVDYLLGRPGDDPTGVGQPGPWTTLVFLDHQPANSVRARERLPRAWIEHLALSALDLGAEMPRRVLVCPAQGRVYQWRLRGIDRNQARKELEGLLGELLASPHDYLLPYSLLFPDNGTVEPDLPRGAQLRRRLGSLADASRIAGCRWGPVPDPASYPLLESTVLETTLCQRFEGLVAAVEVGP